jgi:hypothetical protein
MDPLQVRSFTERYLAIHGCRIIESSPHHLVTQLSVEADKDLLHRPFYWMYVEKMGMEPQTARLTLVFDPEQVPDDLKGEFLFFGSPRFTRILRSARNHGQFVRLYQEPRGREYYSFQSKPYTPWLAVIFKISYVCDRKKDRLASLGINLVTGEIREEIYPSFTRMNWTSRLPAQRHTLRPHLSVAEAVSELEYHLHDRLERDDRTWAEEAMERLGQELEQLERFFPEEGAMSEERRQEKKQRQQETVWQYHPRIEVETVGAGLFHIEQWPEA